MKHVVLLLFAGCAMTRSATESIPSTTAYCEPKHENLWLCREDDGTTYRCVNERGAWTCKELP